MIDFILDFSMRNIKRSSPLDLSIVARCSWLYAGNSSPSASRWTSRLLQPLHQWRDNIDQYWCRLGHTRL